MFSPYYIIQHVTIYIYDIIEPSNGKNISAIKYEEIGEIIELFAQNHF